jgi:hypothetical protein
MQAAWCPTLFYSFLSETKQIEKELRWIEELLANCLPALLTAAAFDCISIRLISIKVFPSF